MTSRQLMLRRHAIELAKCPADQALRVATHHMEESQADLLMTLKITLGYLSTPPVSLREMTALKKRIADTICEMDGRL